MLRLLNILVALVIAAPAIAQQTPRWMTLPPTPSLPPSQASDALAQNYQVIVIDSRGHGRSTRSAAPYGYELMASDVLGVMDRLGIRRTAIVGWSDVLTEFMKRNEKEYQALSPAPAGYKPFVEEISAMWAKQPDWTKADLARIAVPTWIVDGDHDEAIQRANTELMADTIPRAGLLLQPEVSHFSMLPAPDQFTADMLRFLQRQW